MREVFLWGVPGCHPGGGDMGCDAVNPWRERVEIGEAVLYLGDCLEVLPTLGKVDAVVTDPPYGTNTNVNRRKWNGEKMEWLPIHGDDSSFNPSPFLKYPSIIWGANNFSNVLPIGDWLVWDKKNGNPRLDNGTGPGIELAWMPGTGKIHLFRELHWGVVNSDSIKGNNDSRFHPTQKTIKLMAWCLSFLSDAQTILDPFMGSGTTGVACAELGRRFIGIEIEPKYFEIACKRIKQAYAQPRLFPDAKPKARQIELEMEG